MKPKFKISRESKFSILSIILALIIGSIIILASKENPLEIYYYMIIYPLGSIKNILNIFYIMTPIMMTGLAFIIASNANMINLGLEGQLLLGSITAAFVATLFPSLPVYIYIPVILISAMIIGAIWGIIPGYLKLKFGASEIVTCIMLNYVAQFLINYIVSGGFFKHESIDQRTPYILPNSHLTSFSEFGTSIGTKAFRGVQLNAMFIIALIFVVIVYIFLEKTTWGYKVRAVGLNIKATTSNRINSKKTMLLAIAFSGAVAGAAALGEILGTFNGYVEGFSPNYGFSGISVALLGRGKPFGVILGAIFFSVMDQGMMYIGANTGVPKDFVKVIQTLIIIFIIISPYLEERWDNVKIKRQQMKEVEAK